MPEGLPGINFNQCLPRSQEVLGVLVTEAGPCVRQLTQEGPAAGGEALGDEGLGFWLQRADLGNCSFRAEPQSGEDVVHSLLLFIQGQVQECPAAQRLCVPRLSPQHGGEVEHGRLLLAQEAITAGSGKQGLSGLIS